MKSPFNKVLIIGLGQLGLPVAKCVTEKGFDIYGYDISHQATEHSEGCRSKESYIMMSNC